MELAFTGLKIVRNHEWSWHFWRHRKNQFVRLKYSFLFSIGELYALGVKVGVVGILLSRSLAVI